MEAWLQNIFSPNAQFPDIVDRTVNDAHQRTIDALEKHSFERKFLSPLDMYQSDMEALNSFIEAKTQDSGSVCTSVTIAFNQTVTLTRQAFEGTLKINNTSDKPLQEIQLDLVIKDEDGIDRTDLFQINKDAFLDGQGEVAINSENSGKAIFIPTKEAAPQVPVAYSFGGLLSYYDESIGERITAVLNPVLLEVNPSPDLVLDYFVQRNILGDDALTTTIVEPSIPAELSVMITNDGFGVASNVTIAAAQPEIVDNEKGLLLDFELLGSALNNAPTELGLLNINFGAIAPKATTIGQWFFTASLLGKFVSYDLEVNHTTDFGNEALSLIKEANLHELIKSVRAYGADEDTIADFLVNDQADAADTPDRIYFSNGTSTEVSEAQETTATNMIMPGMLTTQLTINPSTPGWNYGVLDDPGLGSYKMVQVIRERDQELMPLENFWQTFVTLPDGLEPRYENKLHGIDNITGTETYILSFVSKDENTLTAQIVGLPEADKTDQAVTSLHVIFNTPIDASTLTAEDLELIRQGEVVPLNAIAITPISDTTFVLDLEPFTSVSGFYELSLSLNTITDLEGNTGETVRIGTWIQFIDALGILRFASDQQEQQSIERLEVLFNKPLQSPELLSDRITINGNATSGLQITPISELQYEITGLSATNSVDGQYHLDIDMTQLIATDTTEGVAVQSYRWNVDQTPPEILNLAPQSQGTTNSQFVSQVVLELSEVIVEAIPTEAISILKNGIAIDAELSIQQRDSLTYYIDGLSEATQENGQYQLRIDQSFIMDNNSNQGTGQKALDWQVNIASLAGLSSVAILPDLGAVSDDNITSGEAVSLTYSTPTDGVTVTISEIIDGDAIALSSEFRATQGSYEFPLRDRFGDRRLVLTARDQFGNASSPQTIDVYIDFTELQITVAPIKNNEDDLCYGFDKALITFSEPIDMGSFDKEAVTFETSGVPQEIAFEFIPISDQTYEISGIAYNGVSALEIIIDQSDIRKKSSGLAGTGTTSFALGIPNTYAVTLAGDEETDLDAIADYTVDGALTNGNWLVINGKILESTEKTVKIQWLANGIQSLMFRYQTALGCQATVIKNVRVGTIPLSVPELTNSTTLMFVSPVPNDGIFTLHTNKTLGDFSISIFDFSGKQVYTEENIMGSNGLQEINVSHLPSGIYSLKIQSASVETDLKFLME